MKPLLAIDPGASGGFALRDDYGIVSCSPMPEGMTEQVDTIRLFKASQSGLAVVMERTGTYVPGNSGVAAATFARHCGHLEAACYCLGLPVEQVTPAVWMRSLGALPKDKKERKRAIKELMARTYPHLTVTLKTADALGMLTYEIKNGM